LAAVQSRGNLRLAFHRALTSAKSGPKLCLQKSQTYHCDASNLHLREPQCTTPRPGQKACAGCYTHALLAPEPAKLGDYGRIKTRVKIYKAPHTRFVAFNCWQHLIRNLASACDGARLPRARTWTDRCRTLPTAFSHRWRTAPLLHPASA
jgi:hypothetical protein